MRIYTLSKRDKKHSVFKKALAILAAGLMATQLCVSSFMASDSAAAGEDTVPACTCSAVCTDKTVDAACGRCKTDFSVCTYEEKEAEKPAETQTPPATLKECVCTVVCADGKANESCLVCKSGFAKCEYKMQVCVCDTLCEADKVNESCTGCKAEFAKCTARRTMDVDAFSIPQDLLPFITKVELRKPNAAGEPGDEITSSTPGTFPVNQPFCVVYRFASGAEGVADFLAANTEYTLVLPDTLSFPSEGTNVTIIDESDKLIGAFSIMGKTLTLKTAVQSADTVDFAQPITGGYFWFGAELDKNKIINLEPLKIEFSYKGGKNEIEIRTEGKQIDAKVEVLKSGVADLANNKIEWTITVKSTIENAQTDEAYLYDLVIKDNIVQSPKHTYVANSVDVTKGGSEFTGMTATPAADGSSVEFKFPTPLSIAAGDEYVIKYKTSFALDALAGGAAIFKNEAGATFQFPQYDLDEWKTNGVKKVLTDKKLGVTDKVSHGVEVKGEFLEKSGQLSASAVRQIDWTVNLNKNSLAIDDAVITDTLDPGLTYILDSIQLGGVPINSSNYQITGTGAADAPQALKLNLGNINGRHILTYSTEVTESFWNNPLNFPFKNKVSFVGGPGSGSLGDKTASVNPSTSMMSKSGIYDPKTHTYTWTISLGDYSNINGKGFKLEDVLNENLVYIPDSFSSTGLGSITQKYVEGTRTLTVEGTSCAAGTITFKTALSDANKDTIWGNNYSKANPFANAATLTVGIVPYTVSNSPDVTSEVIAKKSLGYNPSTKTAKWEMTVNRNQMAIKNPVVTDTVKTNPNKWSIDPASVTVSQGGSDIKGKCTVSTTGSSLTVNLPELIEGSDPVIITYETKLNDESLIQNNTEYMLKNEAKLVGDTIKSGGVTVGAEQNVQNSVVKKSGKAVQSDSSINWSILINENLIKLNDVVLTDPLEPALQFDAESFKLYKLAVGADGKVISTGGAEVPIKPGQLSYESGANTFVFKIPGEISDAYRLDFNTPIDLALKPVTVSNEIGFGNSASGISSDTSVTAAYAGGGGGGASSNKGSLTIIKKGEGGELLAGAEFSIGMLTLKTGSNGEAHIDRLNEGSYTVTETKAPNGYLLAEPQSVTIVRGENAVVTFVDKKIESGGNPGDGNNGGGGNSGGGSGNESGSGSGGNSGNQDKPIHLGKNGNVSSKANSEIANSEPSPGAAPTDAASNPGSVAAPSDVAATARVPAEVRQTEDMTAQQIGELLDKGWVPLGDIPEGLTREQLIVTIMDEKIPLGFYLPSTGDSSIGVLIPFLAACVALLIIVVLLRKKRPADRKK